jgi:hypothetical protein
MWLRNLRTEEIGWHHSNQHEIKTLLVYIKKTNAWITALWNIDETECVEDMTDEPPF